MAAQAYFPIARSSSPSTSPISLPQHYSLDTPSAPRRIYLQPLLLDADNSPSRHAISFSSWTRFSASAPSSPDGQLKASILCKASGTSASYDPPASEWTYLGADQPVYVGKPMVERRPRRKSPLRVECAVGELEFGKQPVKRASTESQLTNSIKTASFGNEVVTTARKYGLEGFTCEDLPSAFDDSDDEG